METLPILLACYLAQFFPFLSKWCQQKDTLINLSNYEYPKPKSFKDDGLYRVAIFGTNDIHGAAFPTNLTHPITHEQYEYGGMQYMSTYIKILKKQWRNKFLWLDGGDQFQGGLESRLSNGSIITDIFNIEKLDAVAIGNHEFDFGQDFLKHRMEESKYDYFVSNVYNRTTQQALDFPNTRVAKIIQVGRARIGIFGMTTVLTPQTTSGNLTNIEFLQYRDIAIKIAAELRAKGAQAVILTAHIGLICPNDSDKFELKMRNSSTPQGNCSSDEELSILLNSLPPGTIDLVIGGHVHEITHHWINGVPVVENISGGTYSHVIYLPFNLATGNLVNEKIEIEGPLPTCGKVFSNTHLCNKMNIETAKNAGNLSDFTFHGEKMEKDHRLDDLMDKWWNELQKFLTDILAFTEDNMIIHKDKDTTLGNYIADILKNVTDSSISVLNRGGFRTSWNAGNISVASVYNMFPFENKIVSFEMTGEEVKRMFEEIQSGKFGAFYVTSGVVQNVTTLPTPKLLQVKLFQNEQQMDIQDEQIYTVSTIDFLVPNGGDDFSSVVKWYKPKNYKDWGVMRDYVMSSVKSVKYFAKNAYIDSNNPRLRVINSRLRGSQVQVLHS